MSIRAVLRSSALVLISVQCLALSSSPASTQDPVTLGIAGFAALSTTIGQMISKLQEILDNATRAGDFLISRVAQEQLFVLTALQDSLSDLNSEVFEELSEERQAILNEVGRITDGLVAGGTDFAQTIEGATDQIDRLIRDTTFQFTPAIYRVRGNIISPYFNIMPSIRVQGFNLGDGMSRLLLRGESIEGRFDGVQLIFDIPKDLLPSDGAFYSEYANLKIEFKTNFNILRSISYDIHITILPEIAGNAIVEYDYFVQETQSEVREFAERHSYGPNLNEQWGCRFIAHSPQRTRGRFVVGNGQTSVIELSRGRDGELRDLKISETGVSFSLCARRPLFATAPGHMDVLVRLVEAWDEERSERNETHHELRWTETIPILFENVPNNIRVQASDFTGYTGFSGAEGGKIGQFLEVRYLPDPKALVLSPLLPQAALGN